MKKLSIKNFSIKNINKKNIIKYLKLLLIIIALLLVVLPKRKVEPFSSVHSKILNPNRFKSKKIHYLYWTGGYDSTFRLCEMLVNEKKIVQPIYVALLLDNDCASEETCNKLWLRRNRKEEQEAMNKILIKIKEKFPNVRNNILPVLTVDEPIEDDVFNYNYEKEKYIIY